MKKKIGVIGASGHVGNNICRTLLSKGYLVKGLVYKSSEALENLEVEQVRGDICDLGSLFRFLEDVDLVIHAAGKASIDGDPDGSVWRVNVEGTRNVVEAALESRVEKLVYVSSIHALSQRPSGDLDESRDFVGHEGFHHDFSKSVAEQAVMEGARQGLNVSIITPTAMIGPYDFRPSLLGQGLIALYNRKVPALVSGGFNWVDVRDVAKAAVSAMEKGKSGERYIIAGVWKTVRELAVLVQEITGSVVPKFTSPHWLAKMGVPLAKAYSAITNTPTLYTKETLEVLLRCNRKISSLKAKTTLGFYPRPLEETLQDTFRWFEEVGRISAFIPK